MDSKRKILIISYFFPPCNLVGAQRPYSWFRYFHEFGLYPVVITRHWNREVNTLADASLPDSASLKVEKHEWGEVHYLPYTGTPRDRFLARFGNRFSAVRKVLTVAELVLQFLFFRFNPYRFFYRYAERLLNGGEKFHTLIISGNPFPQFAVGYHLTRKYDIPWVADYRDDWTTNTRLNIVGFIPRLIRKLEKHAEIKWVSSSSFFVSVTDDYIQKISSLTGKRGFLILNGFDSFKEYHIPPISRSLVMLYAGTVYEKQDFKLLQEGLLNFKELNPDVHIEIVFAGAAVDGIWPKPVSEIYNQLHRKGVDFKIFPRMSQSDFDAYLSASHTVFTVPYGKLKGEMPAKLFHYLSWNRPILLAGTDHGVMEETLRPYSAACIASTAEEVAAALEQIYQTLKEGNFGLSPADREYIQRFTRRNQARILADLLKGEGDLKMC